MTKKIADAKHPLACVVLAAGMGTRMKSAVPKILHKVAGRAMVSHVVAACQGLKPDRIVVVVSPSNRDMVAPFVAPCECAVQASPLGSGDALKAARDALSDFTGDILVISGDVPLVTTDSLHKLIEKRHKTAATIVVGAFVPPDAGAYGRLITNDKAELLAIVEAKDATPEQLAVKACNSATYVFDSRYLWSLLDQIKNDNAKKEFYLTDTVLLARTEGLACTMIELPPETAMGVNSRVELAEAEKAMQQRLRREAMLNGVTMADPDTVYLSFDTKLGSDVYIGQNVVFGLGVEVADNVEIRAFSHLEKAKVGKGALIGPYARLRPDAIIGEDAHIGNFVEIKKAEIAKGAKVNHLSYIGDAFVGSKANIGAGTITCNYDGFHKHHTHIGAGAFIGSNSSLVAPVNIGDGAIIGAGSVITKDVATDALAVTRAQQTVLDHWANRFREAQKKSNES